MRATTRDIGFAIRNFLESEGISTFADDPKFEDGLIERSHACQIDFIDVSDANNPLVHLDNGQKFRVRIVAED